MVVGLPALDARLRRVQEKLAVLRDLPRAPRPFDPEDHRFRIGPPVFVPDPDFLAWYERWADARIANQPFE